MGELNQAGSRRTFRWPGTAREMVRTYLNSTPSELSGKDGHGTQAGLKALITRIAAVSGNPRGACWRFVRQSGVTAKRSYRQWTKTEQQKLLDLIASHSFEEVTVLLRRSPTSVRAMLHRLGASARMGQDWFTKHTLAEASKSHFLRYSARYIRRPPIASWRLLEVTDRGVEFVAKDAKRSRSSQLDVGSPSLHLLAPHVPDTYRHAIRYFGLLAPRAKGKTSTGLFVLLRQTKRSRPNRLSWRCALLKYFGFDSLIDSHGQEMYRVRRERLPITG